MLKEIQNGFLDSDSKLNFQDKHNMSSNKHKGQFRLEGNFPWKSEWSSLCQWNCFIYISTENFLEKKINYNRQPVHPG